LGYAQALADIDNNENWYRKIYSIHDYKGILSIQLKYNFQSKEIEYLKKAWESIITDYESEDIEFSLVKKKYKVVIEEKPARIYAPVDNISDLLEILKNRGILTINVEGHTPFDEIPDTIRVDLDINEIDEVLFKALIADKNVCTIIPNKKNYG